MYIILKCIQYHNLVVFLDYDDKDVDILVGNVPVASNWDRLIYAMF